MYRKLSFILLMIVCFACSTNQNVPKVVPSVDLERYAGKWYEIASFPVSFEKGCSCISADYTLTGRDYVKVFNSCRKGGPKGKISSITGKAFVVPGSNNAKLKVQFFWPIRAPYWIIGLADDYSWAIVSGPSRKYLWILSRSSTMDPLLYSQLIDKLKLDGFDTNKIVKADQGCD